MTKNEHIVVCFMTEKKVEHGEDAPPLSIDNGTTCAVGVFDGMGGAGAATCNSSLGNDYTKAYVASRLVSDTLHDYLVNHLNTDDVSEEDMKVVIQNRLKQEQENYPPETKSILRSKLVRDYPTTLALVTLRDRDETRQIDSYWAGDSHCYLWTKDGFFQISIDDLEENNDPMENLHNDSPISNCICADRVFHIGHRRIILKNEPVVILCATDGCFGYYQTPMHFAHILKSCLSKSKNENEWQEIMKLSIQKVTGDDTSLSLIGVGFDSFEMFKKMMLRKSVSSIKKINGLEREMKDLRTKLEQKSNEYEIAIKVGWDSYKQNYMKYLNDDDNGNA